MMRHGPSLKIVLASRSPVRKRALDLLGLTYEVRPSCVDERAFRTADARELVLRLSDTKARAVGASIANAIIIAGDAVVMQSGSIYEKPVDAEQAREFLMAFSGNAIEYVSAVTVLNSGNGTIVHSLQASRLTFRRIAESEIADYISRYDVLSFAGALDGDGILRFAESVSGSLNFMTGFAVSDLVRLLREQGVKP